MSSQSEDTPKEKERIRYSPPSPMLSRRAYQRNANRALIAGEKTKHESQAAAAAFTEKTTPATIGSAVGDDDKQHALTLDAAVIHHQKSITLCAAVIAAVVGLCLAASMGMLTVSPFTTTAIGLLAGVLISRMPIMPLSSNSSSSGSSSSGSSDLLHDNGMKTAATVASPANTTIVDSDCSSGSDGAATATALYTQCVTLLGEPIMPRPGADCLPFELCRPVFLRSNVKKARSVVSSALSSLYHEKDLIVSVHLIYLCLICMCVYVCRCLCLPCALPLPN